MGKLFPYCILLWVLTSNQKVLIDTTHIKKVITKQFLYCEKQNN